MLFKPKKEKNTVNDNDELLNVMPLSGVSEDNEF